MQKTITNKFVGDFSSLHKGHCVSIQNSFISGQSSRLNWLGVDFSNTIFSQANLSELVWNGSESSGLYLRNSEFHISDFAELTIKDVTVYRSLWTNIRAQKISVGAGVMENLKGNFLRIEKAAFSALNWLRVNLDSVEVRNFVWNRGQISHSSLTNAEIDGTKVSNLQFASTTFADWVLNDMSIEGLQIADSTIDRLNLTEVTVENLKISNSRISNLTIKSGLIRGLKILNNNQFMNVQIKNAQILSPVLSNTPMSYVTVENSNIIGAIFTNVTLNDAIFRRVNFVNSDLRGLQKGERVQFEDCTFDANTQKNF